MVGQLLALLKMGIMLAGEFPASPLENSIILQMRIRRQNVLSDAESHCSVHNGCMHHPYEFLMTISRRYANVYAVEKCVVGCRRGPFQWQCFHSVEDKIKCCIILELAVGSLNLYY
jgi:hypothetical protein